MQAVCILLFLAALGLFFYILMGLRVFWAFARRGSSDQKKYAQQEGAGTHRAFIEQRERETLTRKSPDGLTLSGTLLRAEKPRGTTVFLLHGYLGNGIDHMGMFVPFYLERGFDVFLPDHRAHGESEGHYIGFGEPDAHDCIEWCRELMCRFPAGQKILLHGISMGAAAACTAAGNRDLPQNVIGVVSDCAFSSCEEQFTHSLNKITPISAKILLPAANLWCKLLAGYDLFRASALEGVRASRLPFLFIHGAEDRFVPTHMGKDLYEACPDKGKVLWIVPEAKHFLSYRVDPAGYEKHLETFFKRIEA